MCLVFDRTEAKEMVVVVFVYNIAIAIDILSSQVGSYSRLMFNVQCSMISVHVQYSVFMFNVHEQCSVFMFNVQFSCSMFMLHVQCLRFISCRVLVEHVLLRRHARPVLPLARLLAPDRPRHALRVRLQEQDKRLARLGPNSIGKVLARVLA